MENTHIIHPKLQEISQLTKTIKLLIQERKELLVAFKDVSQKTPDYDLEYLGWKIS